MKTDLEFTEVESALEGAHTVLFIGRAAQLASTAVAELLPTGAERVWEAMLDGLKPGDMGAGRSSYLAGSPTCLVAAVLPEINSRGNTPARSHAVASLVRAHVKGPGPVAIILALEKAEMAGACAAAVARALPEYSRKTVADPRARRQVRVGVVGNPKGVNLERLQTLAEAVRMAARLVDMPPSELNTEAFVDIARATAARLDVQIQVIEGEGLAAAGLGGLWGVGKAATHGPALVILEYAHKDATHTVALVGKGIVYDTGGLSIKTKTGMPGMKGDMGGAAAVLGAFVAAVEQRVEQRVVALLCLAENSVGPDSIRPDDILTMYSGKTVEVNNTDAEGRLVLADGVAYAVQRLNPDVIVDIATLTGAQLMAVGKRHAASLCNDDDLEAFTIDCGRSSGDLVHPVPFAPEFFRGEFKSVVADLKNSVKDRMNGQVSCAGHFIGEHLGDFNGKWLHLDIAGPSGDGEWGTGYGVALLLEMLTKGL